MQIKKAFAVLLTITSICIGSHARLGVQGEQTAVVVWNQAALQGVRDSKLSPDFITESFGMTRDGKNIVASYMQPSRSLVVADGVPGIAAPTAP